MPEPTFLQIQGRGDSAMRMIEMPLGPVRIGRGPYCEVRLGDPGLGDVQCMLRRRGSTWHFQPVGPSGHVWIDGRAADQQRPLPLGVPFRVGEHWLVLRPADSATNDWGSFDTPISVDPNPSLEVGPRPVIAASAPVEEPSRPRTAPASGSDDAEERLRRWEARLDQRERWLKDRQDERRWEARWKSAGETIRAKSAPPAARPSTSPRTPVPTPPPAASPTPPPGSTPRSAPRPIQTPPVARIIEPRRAEPVRRAADPSPRLAPPRVEVRPLTDPPTPIRRPAAPSRVEPRPLTADRPTPPVAKPEPPTSRAMVILAPVVVVPEPEVVADESPSAVPVVGSPAGGELAESSSSDQAIPGTIGQATTLSQVEREEAGHLPRSREASGRPPSESHGSQGRRFPLAGMRWVGRGVASPLARPAGSIDDHSTGHALQPRPLSQWARDDRQPTLTPEVDLTDGRPTDRAPLPGGEEARTVEDSFSGTVDPIRSSLIESSAWIDEVLPVAIEEARRAEFVPAVEPTPAPAEVAPAIPEPRALPREAGPNRAEWPSARAIFEAQTRRVAMAAAAEPIAARSSRRKVVEPAPTEAQAPPSWSMPLWLGWFPVLLATTVLGAGGVALACVWAVDTNNAAVAIRLATRAEGAAGSPVDTALIPQGGWWTSMATHQAAWALALARADDGENHSEEIRSLLDSAGATSRLAARSRFLVEPADATPEPGSSPDLSHLGRSRDVVTLTWAGRKLRKEGKLDAAIRAYRSAMEIALKANSEDLDPPSFPDDPRVRRYALPREALLSFAARAMARDGDWTADQWDAALPPSATAFWVASRVFAGLGRRADADRLADRAILQLEEPTAPGHDPAEAIAAGAEALAYRGRWTDAAERYRRAIDLAEHDATRRMWWLNLAELAQRTNDDALRVRAIEAAKAPTTVDEITRRALKYQQTLPASATASNRP